MKTRMFYLLSFFAMTILACTGPGKNSVSLPSSSTEALSISKTLTSTELRVLQTRKEPQSSAQYSYMDDAVVSSDKKVVNKTPGISNWEKIREQYNVPVTLFTISPSVADTLVYAPSGTTIIIPPYAFIDQNGKVITDSVTIEYREFHTIKEIFFSGINMEYLISDEKNIFESNGMYELNVSYQNEPAEIKDDQPLVLNMALNGSNEGYNFYVLNKTNNDWSENKEAIVDNTRNEEKYYTEEIIYEKPSLGIKMLDKSVWGKYTWGKANDTYFQLVFNPKMYPELVRFEQAVFQVHQTGKEFTTSMGLNYATKKVNTQATEYILCNEMLITAVKEKSGYVSFAMKSKDFNETFEAIIYVPELKTEQDFLRTLLSFESAQKAELYNRNSKREKKLTEHTNYTYVPTKTALTQNLITSITGFEGAVYVKSPGIGNWDKPYPYIGPPLANERQIVADVEFQGNHAPVGKIYVADVLRNRMITVSEKDEGKYRFNIAKDAEMMIWTVDESGNAGMLTDKEIDLEALKTKPKIKLPVYKMEELSNKLESFSAKVLDNKKEGEIGMK